MMYVITAKEETRRASAAELDSVCAELVAKYGAIDSVKPLNSDWGATVIDPTAAARIAEQHAKLNAAGIGTDGAAFAHGTRMADVGYSNQTTRAREHAEKLAARDAAEALAEAVRSEKRRDVECSAAELGATIEANGRIKGLGLTLNERAIRGLLGRLESPALSYVLGVRDRIAEERAKAAPDAEAIRSDRARIAETLRHECLRAGDTRLKLRTREAMGDCFAVVSPDYAPADAPEVVRELLSGLPSDARATWAYDPASTSWELRASVWTPTPVQEQAVGEPFEGYVSFQSRDNGTGGFNSGGGVIMLACLNASTYVSETAGARRRHVGRMSVHVRRVIAIGTKAIAALCDAWGVAREAAVETPAGLRLSEVIPDFWSSMLTQREYEFAGVLPGRSKDHAVKLAASYFAQRRDAERVTRADMAQAWTHYAQKQPAEIRREAESAAGAWLVSGRPLPPVSPRIGQAR